jgi:phosphate transport system protein
MIPEKHFHDELAEVNDMLLGMSSLVLEIFDDAVESVLTDNVEQAHKVIDERGRVDSLEVAIEERCLALIALHQPVAIDLRMIITAINIIRDLERIDDISIDICQDALGLHELENKPDTLFDLPALASVSASMVHDAVRAFVKRDAAWARRVCEMDDEADDLERRIYRDIIAYAEKNPHHRPGARTDRRPLHEHRRDGRLPHDRQDNKAPPRRGGGGGRSGGLRPAEERPLGGVDSHYHTPKVPYTKRAAPLWRTSGPPRGAPAVFCVDFLAFFFIFIGKMRP